MGAPEQAKLVGWVGGRPVSSPNAGGQWAEGPFQAALGHPSAWHCARAPVPHLPLFLVTLMC